MYYSVLHLIDLVSMQSRLAQLGCNDTHDLEIVPLRDGLGTTPSNSICTPDFSSITCASYFHLSLSLCSLT
jgi:hypothetical protein